jgi:hypothetical protein
MHNHTHRYYCEDAVRDLEDSFQITNCSDEVQSSGQQLSSITLPVDSDGDFGVTQRELARLRGSVYVLLHVLAHVDYETAAAMQFHQNQQQQQNAYHWPLNDQSEDMQIC